MARVPIHPEAFTLSRGGLKRPRERDDGHLKFIRTLPCVFPSGCQGTVEAAHVRFGDLRYGKRECGKGEKPDDCWTLPLCQRHHRLQHSIPGERAFWRDLDKDALTIAALLFLASGDEARGRAVVIAAQDGVFRSRG